MEIIATNPERRDPGFSENKLDLGLGRVDNISSTDLLNVIVKSAKIIANEKTIGDNIQSTGEGFFPIFETAEISSTCSVEVGFFDTLNNELSSFDVTFSYFDDDISYLLNVAPGAYRIEEMYLRIIKKDDKLIGGIYWSSGDLFDPSYNFNRIGVNLIHWTEGSRILDPSANQIALYNINNKESGCVLIIDIPLRESSSTIDYAASSFVLYDAETGKRLIGTDANYTSDQLKNIDAPTINGVPFLLKRGTTVDGKIDARHITVPAKHEDSHIEKAGGHNWDVLERIRKAGLIQNKDGAEHSIGEMLNIDDLHYGVTRLSGYDKLDTTTISVEKLNSWLDSLGYDTDVISVGLFKNFVGYLCKLIDSSYNPRVLDFSLENSAHEFIFITASGSNGTEILFNTYRRDYSSTGYVNTGIFGSETLLGYTKDDPEGIIESVTFSKSNDTQVVANIKMTRNSSEDSRSATVTFKQLNETVPTGLPDITVHIFQEGFVIEYGYLCGETEDDLVPIFEGSGLIIYRDYNQFSTTRILKPIVTENTELGYKLINNVQTRPVLDEKAKSWSSLLLSGNILTASGLKNESSYKRTASGYLAMYSNADIILGRVPVTIIQGSVEGYLELDDHYINARKSGETVSTNVNSNYAWTIDVNTVPSWITVSGFTGSRKAGKSIITFIVSENSDTDRTAKIKFINDFGNTDILEITQLGKSGYLDIVGFPDTDIFLSISPRTTGHYGRNVVNLTFNTDKIWVIDYKPSWLGINYTSGPARQGFTIKLTYTGDGYISGTQGDYISFGYFDTTYNAIVSLRKVYIDLRSWGPKQSSNYTDSGSGAYLFGPTYSELLQGDTAEIYCLGNSKQLKSNISGALTSYFDVTANSSIEEQEFEFTDSTWINIDKFPVGIEYPNISSYTNYFKCFKRGIRAIKSYGASHYSLLKNIESPVCRENEDTVTDFEIINSGFTTTYLGVPSSSNAGNPDTVKVCYRRTMKTGISVEALEGGNKSGIVLSGESQVITLKASPKYTEDNQQGIVHFFLLNQTLPGWLYFEESLTSQNDITKIGQFGEKEYKVHILPNRTGEQRSVTLQICDRGMMDTLINYTITQDSTILTTTRELKSVVPILSSQIEGPGTETIEVLLLYTWEDKYSINGSEYATRTYRELPSYSSATIRIDSGSEWFSIRNSNSKNYIEVYANPGSTVREGQITVIAKDDLGNTVTGSLKIYQPSSTVPVQRSVSIEDIKPINVGTDASTQVPLELYSIGYQITGTKTIRYGSETIVEEGELFPESLEDLTISCSTSQAFELSTPLSLIKKDPCGVESISNFSIKFYGVTRSMNLYQELNDIPFELDYSYVQVDKTDFIVPIQVTLPDAVISGNNNRITVTGLSGKQAELYVYINGATTEGTKAVLKKSGELKLIPGTNTGNYDENYGLSLQKPEIIKISNRNGSIIQVLTVVPKPNEGTIIVQDSNTSYTGIDLRANAYSLETVRHGYEIPRAIQISGMNGDEDFGKVLFTASGSKDLWYSDTDTIPQDASNPYFYASKFPTSVIARSLRSGTNTKSTYYSHQSAKTRAANFDPISLFKFSSGMTKTSSTDILLSRDVDEYTIDFSGVPYGVVVSNISVKNNITNLTWGNTRFGARRVLPNINHELVFYTYSIGSDSDIRGEYPEYETDGNSLSVSCIWGGYSGGTNRGQDLYYSGEDFQIATITFRFRYYSTDGIETVVEKSINLYYEGKEYVAELGSPANGELILRTDNKNDAIGIVDANKGSWSGSGGTYPLKFTTEGNWMIYLKSGKGSWNFNGNGYSSTWSSAAGNSGYNSSLTTNTVNVGLEWTAGITDLTNYSGTTVTSTNLARFEVLTSPRDTSSSTWNSKSGPAIYFRIGPALPFFGLNDNISGNYIGYNGSSELKFAYFRSSRMLRACFSLDDCPYNLSSSQVQNYFGKNFSQSIAGSPTITGDTESHGNLEVYPPRDWSCRLVYVPSEGNFYITYYSVEDDIAAIDDYDIDGNPVGNYSIDLKDPYTYPGTPYSILFSGVVDQDASGVNSNSTIPGELVLFRNDVYYDHIDPDPGTDPEPGYPELDPGRDYSDDTEYYYLNVQEAYGEHDVYDDGNGTPSTLGGNYAYVLHCYDRSIADDYYIRYSGDDTKFYYVVGTPDSYSGSGYPDESWSFTYNIETARLATLDELAQALKQADEYKSLIIWRTGRNYNNVGNTLTVYRRETKDWNVDSIVRPNSTTDLTYDFPQNGDGDASFEEYKVKFITEDGYSRNMSGISSTWYTYNTNGQLERTETVSGDRLLSSLTGFMTSWQYKVTIEIPNYVDQENTGAFYIYHRFKVDDELSSLPEIGPGIDDTESYNYLFSVKGLKLGNSSTVKFRFPEITSSGKYNSNFTNYNGTSETIYGRYLMATTYFADNTPYDSFNINSNEDVAEYVAKDSYHDFLQISVINPTSSDMYKGYKFDIGLKDTYSQNNLSFKIHPYVVDDDEGHLFFQFPILNYRSIFGETINPTDGGPQLTLNGININEYQLDALRYNSIGNYIGHAYYDSIEDMYYNELLNSYYNNQTIVVAIEGTTNETSTFEFWWARGHQMDFNWDEE